MPRNSSPVFDGAFIIALIPIGCLPHHGAPSSSLSARESRDVHPAHHRAYTPLLGTGADTAISSHGCLSKDSEHSSSTRVLFECRSNGPSRSYPRAVSALRLAMCRSSRCPSRIHQCRGARASIQKQQQQQQAGGTSKKRLFWRRGGEDQLAPALPPDWRPSGPVPRIYIRYLLLLGRNLYTNTVLRIRI